MSPVILPSLGLGPWKWIIGPAFTQTCAFKLCCGLRTLSRLLDYQLTNYLLPTYQLTNKSPTPTGLQVPSPGAAKIHSQFQGSQSVSRCHLRGLQHRCQLWICATVLLLPEACKWMWQGLCDWHVNCEFGDDLGWDSTVESWNFRLQTSISPAFRVAHSIRNCSWQGHPSQKFPMCSASPVIWWVTLTMVQKRLDVMQLWMASTLILSRKTLLYIQSSKAAKLSQVTQTLLPLPQETC